MLREEIQGVVLYSSHNNELYGINEFNNNLYELYQPRCFVIGIYIYLIS